ncbi:MAG: YggT family protein [Caulobacter sp.]
MAAIINFVFFILSSVLTLLLWAIIINAILSWLIAFDVINLRNPVAANIARFLDAVTRPVLRPFQKIIPTMGGVDISPIFAMLVIQGVNGYLLPALHGFLLRLAGF